MKRELALFTQNQEIFEQLSLAAKDENYNLLHNPQLTSPEDLIVICDLESFKRKNNFFNKLAPEYLYVISAESDEDNMRLIDKYQLHHLVGYNQNVFAAEIINHIKKTNEGKIWGFETYLDGNSKLQILSLSDSKFTNEMVQDAIKHFDFKDYFSSPNEYIQVMANELISNSLYKGPKRQRAERGLDLADRKAPVFLKGADLVQVTLGMDEKGVALSVQDSFGGLNYDLLINSIRRSFNEKTPLEKKDGAGLGLYLTFLHSNQFIVNYRENFRTEVICIIEKNKRYKNYKQRIRSFHFFQEVPSEKTNNK